MAPWTIAHIRERGGQQVVLDWMDNEALRIDYVNSFTRVMDAD